MDHDVKIITGSTIRYKRRADGPNGDWTVRSGIRSIAKYLGSITRISDHDNGGSRWEGDEGNHPLLSTVERLTDDGWLPLRIVVEDCGGLLRYADGSVEWVEDPHDYDQQPVPRVG